jgi:hypothetical protein
MTLPREYIVMDSTTSNPMLDELVFGYADLAGKFGYKDVKLVLPRGLLAERCAFAMDEEILVQRVEEGGTGRYSGPMYASRGQCLIPDLNRADLAFLDGIAAAFREHLHPGMLDTDAQTRVKKTAWRLKRKYEPGSCPASEDGLNPFDFDDRYTVMALYSVGAARKHIASHIRPLLNNRADQSVLAWFEGELDTACRTPESMPQYIYISSDRRFKQGMRDLVAQHGCPPYTFREYRRDTMVNYLHRELSALWQWQHSHPANDVWAQQLEGLFQLVEKLKYASQRTRALDVGQAQLGR